MELLEIFGLVICSVMLIGAFAIIGIALYYEYIYKDE